MTALRSLYSIATPPSDVPGVQLGLDEVGDQHVNDHDWGSALSLPGATQLVPSLLKVVYS